MCMQCDVEATKHFAIHTPGPKASLDLQMAASICHCGFAGRTSAPMRQQTLLCWQKALQDASLHATAPAQASEADALLSILQEASR